MKPITIIPYLLLLLSICMAWPARAQYYFTKEYITSDGTSYLFQDLAILSDSSIAAIYKKSVMFNRFEYGIIKFDPDGNILQRKKIISAAGDTMYISRMEYDSSSHSLSIIGFISDTADLNYSHTVLTRLDEDLHLVWSRRMIDSNYSSAYTNGFDIGVYRGDSYLIGSSYRFGKVYSIKMDRNGNVVFAKKIKGITIISSGRLPFTRPFQDGFIISAEQFPNRYLFKMSLEGDIVVSKKTTSRYLGPRPALFRKKNGQLYVFDDITGVRERLLVFDQDLELLQISKRISGPWRENLVENENGEVLVSGSYAVSTSGPVFMAFYKQAADLENDQYYTTRTHDSSYPYVFHTDIATLATNKNYGFFSYHSGSLTDFKGYLSAFKMDTSSCLKKDTFPTYPNKRIISEWEDYKLQVIDTTAAFVDVPLYLKDDTAKVITNTICSNCLPPRGPLLGADINTCGEDTVWLQAQNPNHYTLKWSDGSSGNDLPVTQSGAYWVEATNECGTYRDSIQVAMHPQALRPGIRIQDSTWVAGDTLHAWDSTAGVQQWKWRMDSGVVRTGQQVEFILTKEGRRRLLLLTTDSNGCQSAGELWIEVKPRPLQKTLYMPNAFTPGSNSLNDTLAPVGTDILEYRLLVFNRWGEVIFEGKDTGWDGTFRGAKAPEGVYHYSLKVQFADYSFRHITGSATLLRAEE